VSLRWSWWLAEHDIDFGLTLVPSPGAPARPLLPTRRVGAGGQGAPHSGSMALTESGCYVLSWSNAFSWMAGKTLHWQAELEIAEHAGSPEPQVEA
jgi:hypothetical protein